MKVDKETIRKIVHLSRLEFDEKSEQSLLQDVNKILDWVEKLNEINTENVKPLTHMSEEVNILREDVVANMENMILSILSGNHINDTLSTVLGIVGINVRHSLGTTRVPESLKLETILKRIDVSDIQDISNQRATY